MIFFLLQRWFNVIYACMIQLVGFIWLVWTFFRFLFKKCICCHHISYTSFVIYMYEHPIKNQSSFVDGLSYNYVQYYDRDILEIWLSLQWCPWIIRVTCYQDLPLFFWAGARIASNILLCAALCGNKNIFTLFKRKTMYSFLDALLNPDSAFFFCELVFTLCFNQLQYICFCHQIMFWMSISSFLLLHFSPLFVRLLLFLVGFERTTAGFSSTLYSLADFNTFYSNIHCAVPQFSRLQHIL